MECGVQQYGWSQSIRAGPSGEGGSAGLKWEGAGDSCRDMALEHTPEWTGEGGHADSLGGEESGQRRWQAQRPRGERERAWLTQRLDERGSRKMPPERRTGTRSRWGGFVRSGQDSAFLQSSQDEEGLGGSASGQDVV